MKIGSMNRNSTPSMSGVFLLGSGSSMSSLSGIDRVDSESNAKGEAVTTQKGRGNISELVLIKIYMLKKT